MRCKKCGAIVIVEPCCGIEVFPELNIPEFLCKKCGGEDYYRICGKERRGKK